MDSDLSVPPDSKSDGEKRPAENGDVGDLDAPLRKKARGSSNSANDMTRVAEIILVLSAMGEMRGGRNPTVVEKELMSEARKKLAEMCNELAPKDILQSDAVGTFIEDLGLNRSKDQKLGFRPPKMSIAEKLLFTKRKMEESKEFAARSVSYSSPRYNPAAENRSGRVFPSDKTSHAVIQPASNLGYVSATTSTPSSFHSATNEVRPSMVPSNLPTSTTHLAAPFRLDAKSNGSAFASQVQANVSVDQPVLRAPTWSLQSQSATSSKAGSENKLPDHASTKTGETTVTNTSQIVLRSTRDQNNKSLTTHTPLANSHNEIAKIVQKLVQPQLPVHPTWTPPSRDYMNKSVTCLICKITINEVENVLICDACEKGFHLKCLQHYNQKGIPRGEWHCGKCLHLSNGKPLPPKYGRVMRNISTAKVPTDNTSSEKKLANSEQKVNNHNMQKIMANGISNSQTVDSKQNGLASDSDMPNAEETKENERFSFDEKLDPELKSQPSAKLSDTINSQNSNIKETVASDKDDIKQEEGTSMASKEGPGASSDGLHSVDWIGDLVEVVNEKTYYRACCVDGVPYEVQTFALVCSGNGKSVPTKIQAMWEETESRTKWITVTTCYFPSELPEVVGRPSAPESNEVYESNHNSTVMASLIKGPCEVLPPIKFKEEGDRRTALGTESSSGLQPLFICKWFYDESRGIFRPIPS